MKPSFARVLLRIRSQFAERRSDSTGTAPLSLLLLFALVGAGCRAAPSTPTVSPIPTGPEATRETNPTSLAPTASPSEPASETTAGPAAYTFAGDVPAPDFPAGLDWLNTDRPLSLSRDLRGKIVLLDFWTLGCINCIHIIPDLKRLEAEFSEELVVIGVHSAKFETEGQTESIRQAVLRYDLEHPVVNDREMSIWQAFGARAWPTVFLIDPLGRVVGYHAGEGVYNVIQPVLEVMAEEYAANGQLDDRPLEIALESRAAAPSVLSFPGKILADEAGGRLFIADSNHHRIIITDLDGSIQGVIGSGAPGLQDGTFEAARFDRPHGMALSMDGATLYIADLENHAVRAADLDAETVETIAGTGEQALRYPSERPATETPLSSPWDVLLVGDELHIAMAGVHQIWTLDLSTMIVEVFVGSGREGIDDGPPEQATLAQPSGLATDGDWLYFTDPEASAVRRVPLDGQGSVETMIGTGLFDFGDVDGAYPDARLQHALGIAVDGGNVYLADTYNHKIKVLDPEARTVDTLLGSGEIGWVDGAGGDARLAEPSGLALAGNRLFVADTNNHLIRYVDLDSGLLNTLTLRNLELAMPPSVESASPEAITLPAVTVHPDASTLSVIFDVPPGYKFNDLGPFSLDWESSDSEIVGPAEGTETSYQQIDPAFPIDFALDLSPGTANLRIESTAFYCREGEEAFCLVEDVVLELPVQVSAQSGQESILVEHTLPAVKE